VSDIEVLLYKLDEYYIRLNTVLTSIDSLLTIIIPKLISELESHKCKFYSMRVDSEKIHLKLSYNNNKTCVNIVIEPRKVAEKFITLRMLYYIEGGKCE
jgi:hypothetical protein